jgi:hypothetical protein
MFPMVEIFPGNFCGTIVPKYRLPGAWGRKDGYRDVNMVSPYPVPSQGQRNQIETDKLALTHIPHNWTRSIKE